MHTLRPDVLVTDIEMPRLSGLDLAERVQQEAPQTRVVIVTTFARAGYLRRALDAGARVSAQRRPLARTGGRHSPGPRGGPGY